MRKIRLQLDALTVETFDTSPTQTPRGTVLAFDKTEACTASCGESCLITGCTCFETCPVSCPNGSCWESCGGTCFEPGC